MSKRSSKEKPIEIQRIIGIREAMGLTQEGFAEKIDIAATTYQKIEQCAIKLSLNNAIRIAKVFGYTLDYIYGLSDDTNDDASTMLLYLNKMFSYHADTQHTPHTHYIMVKECVVDFLERYAEINDFRTSKGLPQTPYDMWVSSLKAEFNAAWNQGENSSTNYCLIKVGDYESLKRGIEAELMSNTPRPIT